MKPKKLIKQSNMGITTNFTFIFIRTPKSGSTFVTEILQKHFNMDAEEIPRDKLVLTPRSHKKQNYNFVGSVRNPFAWYVSFYEHHQRDSRPIMQGLGSFKDTLTVLLNLRNTSKYYEMLKSPWACANPIFNTQHFIDYPEDKGFYSWMLSRMNSDKQGNSDDVFFLKVESLNEDLVSAFKKFGKISQNEIDIILRAPKANTAWNHKDYREYYDDEMIAMVYKQDKAIFDKFGYEF